MEFTLKLTEQEAQTVLNALTKEPYGVVAGVIATIQAQAIEQRQKAQK